ncbi:gamma-glutamyl-gamma-aminobutyrate hydrolase family protein [Paenibacillus macerans]|uniref:Peptidase C26 family protein n=1 Tax=Paenibacillus macerans TaxID=44252 RepID=A0A090ZLE0_PAEMA|nr:gamma-glutamyl-gamma-aminobutyrate hydrolase family protein [Paenibacillus macerans]KFN11233.1 peptidase C26 family protein [Paenibacillus macerans]MCY7560239.1 gamma-glutamyl-gamma-aminobutyrate hydrolase family protein [Paenibacillus macerans]MEC0151293.1 gamma-glutamyl-gamma-aminobutyrate hydrolase family protein [Paenibacillus macerans]SUD26806.1 amidotransferase [Paenibacillus macerans]
MKKPLIGVLPLYDEEKDSYWMLPGYMKGVEEAGGIPFMLPLTTDPETIVAIAETFDGFLFTGGHDVSPEIYGEKVEPVCGARCEERDVMEKLLFNRAIEQDKPAFGICRGLQLFNALLGGTLYQDLPALRLSGVRIGHKQTPPYTIPVHDVHIEKGNVLYEIVQAESLKVNSYHHQGIKKLSGQLMAAAVAEDGLIEAVVMPDKSFVLAVQWHPEFNYNIDDSSFRLFKAFVQACRPEQ